MQFPPLIKAKLIKRYKRFIADIELEDGTITQAYCPNTGAMDGLQITGSYIWVKPTNDPKRKYAYEWFLSEVENTIVGINTSLPNKIVFEALEKKQLSAFAHFDTILPESKISNQTRLDFKLINDTSYAYLEVKNVHMKRENFALFPDSVTTRGAKHLQELGILCDVGIHCAMLYLIQRNDCEQFSFASFVDSTYYEAALQARDKGVQFFAYTCAITPTSITIDRQIPVIFERMDHLK